MGAVAYWLLQRAIIATEGVQSTLARAIGRDFKGNLSVLIYVVAIPVAFLNASVAQAGYVLVAAMWLIPDRRIERTLAEEEH